MLYGGWCSTNGTDRDIVRANVGYKKTSGSGVSVALGWERTNRNATVNGGSWWSATYNVAPGQTKEVAFYPGHVAITSTYPCIRAKMKDQISGQLFFGKLLCLA
jgi:hypothetical protein